MRDLIAEITALPEHEQRYFLNKLNDAERQLFLQLVNTTPLDLPDLEPHQQIEGEQDASIILFMAGRGAGKTHKGADWAARKAELDCPGMDGALIAPTFQAVREVMVEGRGSGLLDMLGDHVTNYNRSTFEITTRSGSRIYMRSADRPDSIRGLNLAWAWTDEIGAWTKPEAWHEGLMPAMRMGEHPQIMVTTTPRRVRLVKELNDRHNEGDMTIALGHATTFDNPHLSTLAVEELQRLYGDTQLGQQELYGLMITTVVGAVWQEAWITRAGYNQIAAAGGMAQLVIGVDPSSSAEGTGDECGIVVCGRGHDGRGYVIDDRTIRGSPNEWVEQVVDAYHTVYGIDALNQTGWRASYVAIEQDGGIGVFGKELIARLDHHIPVNLVSTRGKSKEDRARPIAMMWERGEISHMGIFDQLEDQMTSWVPSETRGYSPDRVDALVWAMTSLFPAYGFAGHQIKTNDRRLSARGR